MRTAALLFALLALSPAALAIQPKPTGEAPVGPESAREGGPPPPAAAFGAEEPEKIRARREAQERYVKARAARRAAFLAEAKAFADMPVEDVAGWRDEAVKAASMTPAEEEASPLNLGRTLLIFSGVTAFLVLLLRFPPNQWPIWPSGDDEEPSDRSRKPRRRDGPMTVKLKPRNKRWSQTASRG